MPAQAKAYSKFNHNRITQRWINYVSGAIVVGGLIDGLRDANEGVYVITSRLRKPATYAILISGLGNLIVGNQKNLAKRKLLPNHFLIDSLSPNNNNDIQRFDLPNDFFQISNRKFQSDTLIGPLYRFEHLFTTEPLLSQEFDSYNSYRRKQIGGNVLGIGIITTSIAVGFALADNNNGIIGASVIVYGGAGGLFYILINNLANGSKKNKHKSALLSMIDSREIGIRRTGPDIELAITQDGLGLVYRF